MIEENGRFGSEICFYPAEVFSRFAVTVVLAAQGKEEDVKFSKGRKGELIVIFRESRDTSR